MNSSLLRENMILRKKLLVTEQQAEEKGWTEKLREQWNEMVFRKTSCISEYGYQNQQEYEACYGRLLQDIQELETKKEHQFRLRGKKPEKQEGFIGREEYFPQIHQLLQKEACIIYGIGGIGKTALARAYAAEYAEYYDYVIFLSCSESIVSMILDDKQLLIEGFYYQPKGKRGETGRAFRKKMELLQQVLTKDTLMIVDGVDREKDDRLKELLELPCKFLFTSRCHPETWGMAGIEVLPLQMISQQRRLFEQEYDRRISAEEWQEADKLLEMLHGHTLAVKLCAAYLKQFKKEEMVSEIRKLQRNIAKDTELSQQLADIFSLTKLNRKECCILRYLALQPGEGIEKDLFLEYGKLEDCNVLDKLIQRSLVEYIPAENRIYLHPLICQLVKSREKLTFANCRPYVRSIAWLARKTWWKTWEEKIQYRQQLFCVIRELGDTAAEPFSEIIYLVDGCWQLGNPALAEQFALKLYKYGMKKYEDSDTRMTQIRHSIASVYYNWGKKEQAYEWYERNYLTYLKNTSPDVFYYTVVRQNYARALLSKGAYEEAYLVLNQAQSFLGQAIEGLPLDGIRKSPGEGWQVTRFNIYFDMTMLLLEWGKPELAYTWARRREREQEQLQWGHESSLWMMYYCLAMCEIDLQEFESAGSHLSQALTNIQCYHPENKEYLKRITQAVCRLHKEEEDK